MKKLFKTDGIRGKYGVDVTLELAFKVGLGLGSLGGKKVIIGYDTRYSGVKLAEQIEKGCFLANLDCIILGVCSTPKLAYYSKEYECIGVMVTASHNPFSDNGIKVFKNGIKINDSEERLLEAKINGYQVYENHLKSLLEKNDSKIGIDPAHGGASLLCRDIFTENNYYIINDDYNGYDINDKCGALYPEAIRDYVLKNNLDYGFCFDGDADRIIACDNKGNVLDGDYLAYLIASYYQLPSVVLTKMSNLGIVEAFRKNNIEVYLCDSGDKNVYDLMLQKDVVLGAEASGHIINRNWSSFGDAVLNAVNIINILNKSDKKMTDYFKEIVISPAELRNYKVNIDKAGIDKLYQLIEQRYPQIVPYIRLSGTENVLRVYLQCKDKDILDLGFLMMEDEICKL